MRLLGLMCAAGLIIPTSAFAQTTAIEEYQKALLCVGSYSHLSVVVRYLSEHASAEDKGMVDEKLTFINKKYELMLQELVRLDKCAMRSSRQRKEDWEDMSNSPFISQVKLFTKEHQLSKAFSILADKVASCDTRYALNDREAK